MNAICLFLREKEKLKKLINLIEKDNIKLIQFFIEAF